MQPRNLDTLIERQKAATEAFPLISIQQVASQYKVSVRQLRRWEAAGEMPPRTLHGHRKKYDKHDIAALMAARGKKRR